MHRSVIARSSRITRPCSVLARPLLVRLQKHSDRASYRLHRWTGGRSNFFKTELELGHCLRLPQEGPRECDLYLTCAKFVTTRDYAPRMRDRRRRELQLIDDAASRWWGREVKRHRCTVQRLERLLAELGD